ncbi:putative ribonuclease H-like domain-containing protein [Tanacetum coccineum]
MDVKSTFLYGTIEEEVYVCQPPGFEDPQFPDIVYKVYVNDIIFGSTKKSLCVEFEQMMHKRFQMSYMGELTFFLGLQVKQKDDGIFISQDKFQVTPKVSHLHVVMRIFRYLKGQPKLGLWYPRDSTFDLEAFSDSDYAGASLDRKSTTGGCQFLGKRLISWQCKKQTIVANSTTEVEYVAAANCYGQSSRPIHLVADETVIKEWEDKMERDATTVSSLEAKQDSGSGPSCQDTILWGAEAQIRFEASSKQSNDPPLSRVNTLRSGEDSMKLKELMEFFKAGVSKLMLLSLNLLLPVLVYAARHSLTAVRHKLMLPGITYYYWATAKTKKVNGECQIQPLVDEKSVRSDLMLDDAEGTECLPNDVIFEQLTLMGTVASAIICLATNQKLYFSKYIFDNMVKHLEGGVKFLMYQRFVQVFLDKQVEGMTRHKEVYVIPSHTKKVFANMKRPGKGFSGRVTPLFPTMMVQAPEDICEDLVAPFDSHSTPIISQSSSSKPQKKKSRRKQRKDSSPTEPVTDKAHVSTPSYDPPQSGEDSM